MVTPNNQGLDGIEDRIRNLILASSVAPGGDGANDAHHALSRSSAAADGLFQFTAGDAAAATSSLSEDVSATGTRRQKRPNQAQRRQMAAEVTIPVDARPQPAHYSRQTGQQYQSAAQGASWSNSRPQSANFQPSQGVSVVQSHSAHHSRHQQPMAHAAQHSSHSVANWRQQQHPAPRAQGSPYNDTRLYEPDRQPMKAQAAMLEQLCIAVVAEAEISLDEIMEKEIFRSKVELACRRIISEHQSSVDGTDVPPDTIQLKCFGSLASGFATKAADMDLALVSRHPTIQPDAPGSPIPRLLEKAFLEMGLGARLLTRTRVPILKICEKPPTKLRDDLFEARLKWEAGDTSDPDGVHGELHDEPNDLPVTNPADVSGIDDSAPDAEMEKPGNAEDEKSKADAEKLATLKQSKKSFDTYSGLAKATLRKLGGKDLNQHNMAEFTDGEYMHLRSVCVAFVQGLADEELKKRLLSYYSLSDAYLNGDAHRTLAGVLHQVEGEKLAMAWDDRPLEEKDERQEQSARGTIAGWLALQNKETFGADPVAYTKELQYGVELLKKISSLQLINFKQGQFESAASYHSRAIRLMIELGGGDHPDNKVLPHIIARYIAGIYNPEIRNCVEAFAATRGPTTLRAVARRHKSLQLAHDFQKALSKGLYKDEDEKVVLRYIAYLRQPLIQISESPNDYFDFVVAKTRSVDEEILPAILRLSNPANLAPNQPRDTYQDRLEFPNTDVGVQCDINFSAQLGLLNTALLRCYSFTDPRVKPMVLFVKHWAKVRGINSPYRGTLSSYGYVLMVLHFLVNVAKPFVCPNLQHSASRNPPQAPQEAADAMAWEGGAHTKFWNDEEGIKRSASRHELSQNSQPIGSLLLGFFEYFAHGGSMTTYRGRCFDWSRDTLSLRTPGGILSKSDKGWTGAKTVTEVKTIAAPPGSASKLTDSSPSSGQSVPPNGFPVIQEVREIRHRYLFAIEDPFELDHNVARTVTHNGIVAIRDEFRRAWRILKDAGTKQQIEQLLQVASVVEEENSRKAFEQLLLEIHGKVVFDDLERA